MNDQSVLLISDVHQKYEQLKTIIDNHPNDYFVQMGDLGFNYDYIKTLPSDKFRVYGGNHENWDIIDSLPHSLGDFGLRSHNNLPFYFVRGAFSIDKHYRLAAEWAGHAKSYWPEEELPVEMHNEIIDDYLLDKPDLVLTHDCPEDIAKILSKPGLLEQFGWDRNTFWTKTQRLLQRMLEAHQPKVWCFAHWHKRFVQNVNGVLFVCMGELDYLPLNSRMVEEQAIFTTDIRRWHE
jgi:predicted phosphodiesterase